MSNPLQQPVEVVGAASFGNYIDTANPFGLARPPQFFLQALYSYDPLLVIFPSLQEPVYRFCRRRTHTPPVLSLLSQKYPDLKIMFDHRLIGISAILPGPHWGPALLNDIAVIDDERMGGTDKALDAADRLDQRRIEERDRLTTDELDQRGISAYFGLKSRQGSTIFVGGSGTSARA